MSGGGKKGSMKVTLYCMGVLMGIGRAVDELVEIEVGKKKLWNGSIKSNRGIDFSSPWLFGGHTKEGGIMGWAQMMFGRKDQGVNASVRQFLSGRLPAHRGIASFWYYGEICANSPYPKPWRFRVRRTRSGWDNDEVWYPEKIDIWQSSVLSMNPAHILYLIWTGSDFRNLPKHLLDDAAFKTFADQLYSEGFGLCLKWSRQSSLASFIQQILDHVGGAQYTDRSSGLIVPVLLRGGYDPNELPLFTYDNGLLAVDEYTNDALSGSINEVIVNYRDPLDRGNKRQIREKNLGAIHALNGEVRSITTDYAGIPTAQLARRAARRDLNALSGYVRRFKLRFDRRFAAHKIAPASLFRISVPELGIADLVLRVGSYDDGTFRSGEISVEAMTDVFGMPSAVFVEEEPSGYVPPDPTPQPIENMLLVETNYRELAYQLGADGAADVNQDATFMGSIAQRPTVLSNAYKLLTKVKGVDDYAEQAKGIFCAKGLLAADIDYLDNQIVVSDLFELFLLQAGGAALIGNNQETAEVIRVDAIDTTTNTITIGRGCADTVPRRHKKGASIWFYEGFVTRDNTEYMEGIELDVKLQPSTSQFELALTDVIPRSFKFLGRLARPYPPAGMKINGERYPSHVKETDISLSWTGRNRVTQNEQLIDTMVDHITPEENTIYKVKVTLNTEAGNIVDLVDSETADHQADFKIPSPGLVNIEVDALRDGMKSWQKLSASFYSAFLLSGLLQKPFDWSLGYEYLFNLKSNGGVEPITYKILDGDLPSGLVLTGNTIQGTPEGVGAFDFSLQVVDAEGEKVVERLAINIFDDQHIDSVTFLSDTSEGTLVDFKGHAIESKGLNIQTEPKLQNLPTMQFASDRQQIFVSADDSLNINGSFTFEVWFSTSFLPSGNGNPRYLLRKGAGSDYLNGFVMGIRAFNGTPVAFVQVGNNSDSIIIGSQAIEIGRHYHLAGVIQGDQMSLYLNGVLDRSISLSRPPVNNTGALHIGFDPNVPGRNFLGQIGQVRITKNIARYTQPIEIVKEVPFPKE